LLNNTGDPYDGIRGSLNGFSKLLTGMTMRKKKNQLDNLESSIESNKKELSNLDSQISYNKERLQNISREIDRINIPLQRCYHSIELYNLLQDRLSKQYHVISYELTKLVLNLTKHFQNHLFIIEGSKKKIAHYTLNKSISKSFISFPNLEENDEKYSQREKINKSLNSKINNFKKQKISFSYSDFSKLKQKKPVTIQLLKKFNNK
jgi:chromosome segregation ATPase